MNRNTLFGYKQTMRSEQMQTVIFDETNIEKNRL